VPIVAFGSTAIPYTLGDAGILINKKRHVDIAELINLVVEDKKFREQIIKKQRVRLKDFDRESNEKTLRIQLDNIINNDVSLKKTIRIEGTFEDSYSLSIINRNLALALDTIPIFDVSLCVPKMSDDYVPNMKIIKDAKVVELYTKKFDMPDFVIRNVYPPRICDMKGRNNLIYFYWEESRIPKQWTNDFNRLDAILVPSSFVKKVLIDSGVKTQIFVIQNGLNQDILDIDPRKPPEIMTQKKYKFLNISSGFPRKGIDILLNVFSRAFTKDDDVCLILKTFPNIHNNISKLIDDIKATNINCPEIIHIDRDLDENGIAWLYSNSNCLVYPTRGEGFGMSIAEAMLFKIPVIATGHSGHMDFCNEDNCFLIDYKLEPSRTHLKKEWKIGNSSWAEPDSEHLKYLMRFVYENRDKDVVRVKTEEAENTVKKLTWKRTSDDIRNVLNILDKKKKVNLGIVSTFNVRCGIAEYTKYLAENLDSKIRVEILADAEHENINSRKKSRIKVIICWNKFIKDDLEGLYAQIKNDKLTIVHFQFNFGFFRLDVLMDLIKTLRNDSIKTILTFHAVEDSGGVVSLEDYKDDLKYVDRILVHTQNDRKFLSTLGIEKNVICIPHGIMRFPENGKTDSVSILNNSIIISSFGFLLPHKGVLEIIESLPILQEIYPDIIYLAINATYPVDTSKEYFEKCKKRAEELGLGKKVIFFKEFLREEEIIEIIKLSDIVVMPYKDTKESSSAAIRFALSSCRPIIATNLHIFDEFRSEVFTIEKCSPESIAKGIIDLKNNVELQEKLVFNMKKKVDTYSWSNIAKYYEEMLVNICI
jgi:glycosyltransferase involved in cell wall biosynthesis